MSWSHPTTLFRAYKKPNGKVVVCDPEFLSATTKVVRNSDEYYKALGIGWIDGTPQEALDRFELEEQDVSDIATYRAAADQGMSDPAQAEAAAYEASTPQHVPEVPEVAVRKRGRPKKVTL